MKKLIYLITLLPIISLGQVSDATGTSGATTIKNETTPGANTANRVGTNLVNLWNSKGNKQEANTWTALQTFTAGSTNAGLNLGVKSGSDPGSATDGQLYHNSTSDKLRYYDGTWRYVTLNDGLNDNRLVIASSNRLTDDSDFFISGGNTLNATNLIVATSLTNSALTSTRIPIIGTAGLFADDADLTFSTATNTLTATNVSASTITTTSGSPSTIRNLIITGSVTDAGLTLANISGNPSSPVAGHVFFETVTDMPKFYSGSTWYYSPYSDALNAGRVPFVANASPNGFKLSDDPDLTFDGTTTTIGTLQATAISTSGVLRSGYYTPTVPASSNLDDTDIVDLQYMRVGNVATVSGSIDADATAAGSTVTTLELSLPFSTDLVGANQLAGTGVLPGATIPVAIYGNTTDNRAILRWLSQSTSNQTITFHFTYLIQ